VIAPVAAATGEVEWGRSSEDDDADLHAGTSFTHLQAAVVGDPSKVDAALFTGL
jgi:hypothetical protein